MLLPLRASPISRPISRYPYPVAGKCGVIPKVTIDSLVDAVAIASESCSRNLPASWIMASAGSKTQTHDRPNVLPMAVASAAAGAVSRFAGSAMIWFGGSTRSAFRVAESWARFVKTNIWLFGATPRTRRTVSSISVRSPNILRRCFGSCVRLNGQNRSPLPPAIIKIQHSLIVVIGGRVRTLRVVVIFSGRQKRRCFGSSSFHRMRRAATC